MTKLVELFFHSPLAAIILGPIVTLLGDLLHKVWFWLDNQAPWVKQLSAVVLSIILVGLVQLVPDAIPEVCANAAAQGIGSECQAALTSGPFLQAVLTALIAVAFKHGQQVKKS